MDVVYACNEFYIDQTAVSMVSLISHNKDVRLHLVSDNISNDKLKKLKKTLYNYDYELNVVEADELLRDICLSQQGRHPRTIYAKLFLANIINSDRLLYMDSDVIITDSLEDIFQRNMENELAAGVMMPYSASIKNKVGLDRSDPFICDGIVLLNLKSWRAQKISEKCREYLSVCKGTPYMLSEGVLNYVCKGFMGILSPRYNLMPSMIYYTRQQIIKLFEPNLYYDQLELRNAEEQPAAIHFMNELYNRPWYEPCDHPFRETYREIERQLFGNRKYEIKKISNHTCVNRWLYKKIPFNLYLILYKCRHGISEIWRRK